MKRRGFTIIELLVVITLLAIGGWLFFTEKARVDIVQRDALRKIAINSMYYNLEEVFFEKNSYYPATIDSKTLRAVDPALFSDPRAVKIGESTSDYRYDGTECTVDGKCKGYTLRANLEGEGDYVKTNRNT